MPGIKPSKVKPSLPLDVLNDVMDMERKMSTAVARVEHRMEVCINEIKAEQSVIRETQRNLERTLKLLANALQDVDRMGTGSARNPDSESQAQAQVVGKIKKSPDIIHGVKFEAKQEDPVLPGPSTKKRKFEEDSPTDAGMRTGNIKDGLGRKQTQTTKNITRPNHPSPIQTISEAARRLNETKNKKKEEGENKEGSERNADHLSSVEEEERDELESDIDTEEKEAIEERLVRPKPKRSANLGKHFTLPAEPGLVFRNNDRCTGCVNKGLPECTVLKAPYRRLERYVDRVLSKTAERRRPKNSSCFACQQQHLTFCHFPITREKLGPGFTLAHLDGPFPVRGSPEKERERNSKARQSRKKTCSVSGVLSK